MASDISQHYIRPLIFYNNENNYLEPLKRILKPRQRPKSETNVQYKQRLAQWRAKVPYGVDIKLKGNSITQKYYTKQLLPGLITTLYKYYNNLEYLEYKNCILQEDNNRLYSTRSKVNIAREMKEKAYIKVLNHPL